MLPFPVIDNDELAKLGQINADGDAPGFSGVRITGLYRVADGGPGLRKRLGEICAEVDRHIAGGKRFIVLSDRDSDARLGARSRRCCCARPCTTTWSAGAPARRSSLLVEAGDVREVHHVALLIGYGAAAVNPYLAMETVEDLVRRGVITGLTPEKAVRNLVKALGKGVLKVMCKMGVSTVASYRGAQIFEAIGLSRSLVDQYFTGTTSRLGGVGPDDRWPRRSPSGTRWPTRPTGSPRRTARWPSAGSTSGAARASRTCSTRRPCSGCSTRRGPGGATSSGSTPTRVDDQAERLMTLRGLFRFAEGVRAAGAARARSSRSARSSSASPTGAMSYGSISAGGPRDAGDRDEPAGRQVQHRRGRRGPGALRARCPTATRSARRSSRWPRAGSG